MNKNTSLKIKIFGNAYIVNSLNINNNCLFINMVVHT